MLQLASDLRLAIRITNRNPNQIARFALVISLSPYNRWAREIGTICPFGVFPQFESTFWPNLGAIHVTRPIVVLWRFPCFKGISGGFGVLESRIQRPFQAPKTLRFKGARPILKRKVLSNKGKNAKRDKWYPFHACTSPPAQSRQTSWPSPPQRAWFRSISAPFWLRLAPFRVCFGSVSGPFRGVGWGRGGVGERIFYVRPVGGFKTYFMIVRSAVLSQNLTWWGISAPERKFCPPPLPTDILPGPLAPRNPHFS